jgi:Bacterial Ig domain
VPLVATDADGNSLTLRVVSQPAHGTTALSGRQATYYPESGYQGADGFTFAAWDGQTNSNLGTVSVEVGAGSAPPSVSGIAKSANPFRLVVTGANYHAGIQAAIAGHAWANVTRTSDMRLILRGTGLKALFPANTWVPISLTNTSDGLSVTVEYNRTTGTWRFPAI